jgi:hypothetical protein
MPVRSPTTRPRDPVSDADRLAQAHPEPRPLRLFVGSPIPTQRLVISSLRGRLLANISKNTGIGADRDFRSLDDLPQDRFGHRRLARTDRSRQHEDPLFGASPAHSGGFFPRRCALTAGLCRLPPGAATALPSEPSVQLRGRPAAPCGAWRLGSVQENDRSRTPHRPPIHRSAKPEAT